MMKMSTGDKLLWSFSFSVFTFLALSYGCEALKVREPTNKEQVYAGQSINLINDGQVCMTDDDDNCLDAWIMIGKINEAMTHALAHTLDTYGANKPFCLMSGGGNIKEAATMAMMLERHQATTCLGKRYIVNNRVLESSVVDVDGNVVTGHLCMSACPMVIAGGTQRIAYGDVHVGVHSGRRYIDFCICEIPTPFLDDKVSFDTVAYHFSDLSAQGQARILTLYQWGENVDADDILFLSPQEIKRIALFSDMKKAATNA